MKIRTFAVTGAVIAFFIIGSSCTAPVVPDNYTTYESPGQFSISYPPDWTPDTRFIESVKEGDLLTEIENFPDADPYHLVKTIYFGGKLENSSYSPALSISVVPLHEGFLTMEEIQAKDSQYFKEKLNEYEEHSVSFITVDGREATLVDSQENQLEAGKLRFLTLTTTGGGLAWYVLCFVQDDEYDEWEETFETVLRSFKLRS